VPTTPPAWGDLFHSLTAAQHTELFDLAGQQGLLYGHQLPAGDVVPQRRAPLAALLAGRQPDLPSVVIAPRPLHDTALDPYQQQAVWRALQSPDVALIHGQAGTGKSRVAAEILRQAAEQSLSVLFVAPGSSALDQVLKRVHDHPSILALRCLHANELPAHLPRETQALTLDERVRHLREDAIGAARTAETTAQQQVDHLERTLRLTTEFDALLQRIEELTKDHTILSERLARLPDELARDKGTPEIQAIEAQRDQERQKHQQRRTEVQQQQADLDQRRQPLQREHGELDPLVQAKQNGQWWTGAWWRATLSGDALKRDEEVVQQLRSFDSESQQIRDKLAAIDTEAARLQREFDEKITALRQQELERRQSELQSQLTALSGQRDAVTADCQRVRNELGLTEGASLVSHREQRQTDLTTAQQRLDLARRWTQGLETVAASWPDRLAQLANVVATTIHALPLDPHFGDKAANLVHFDLLLLDEAEQVTEAEFQTLSRRCGRCVLIGEAPRDPDATHRQPLNKANRSSLVRPGVFQRLWQQLHCDPRRLPARWLQRDGRLCCELRPIAPEQERWVEREPVLDRSDVELTIVSPPRTPPILAGVSFPANTPLDEAKRFIFGEVQELSIQSAAIGCHWTDEASCLRLHLGSNPGPNDVAVKLLDGITEWVRPAGCNAFQTVALDFCSEAGWHRARAEEWLRSQSSLGDCGRTMVLPRVHRQHPDLAAILHDLQGETANAPESKDVVPSWGHWNAPLIFVPVPSLRGRGSRNGTATPRPRFEPRGAGIEYDLADTNHPPQVSLELRKQLPKQGLVNWMEAEAVVRAVECLVNDATFRRDHRAPLAVTALYPAQVKLIHVLLLASPVLQREHVHVIGPEDGSSARESGLCVEVNVPSAWRQRECSGLLVSLTRSHSHRAVAFGENPNWLPLALTRARTRLALFGDPGTLVRRAQWQGSLDRLDETTATRERDLVGQLVQYLQGQGLHSDRFQLCEGSSA